MTKNIEDMFNDPTPNSYPEEQDEVFEIYLEDGLKPENIKGNQAKEYEIWLSKRGPLQDMDK